MQGADKLFGIDISREGTVADEPEGAMNFSAQIKRGKTDVKKDEHHDLGVAVPHAHIPTEQLTRDEFQISEFENNTEKEK